MGGDKGASTVSESETLLLYRTQSDGSLAELEVTDHDSVNTENDTEPLVIDIDVMPPEESSPPHDEVLLEGIRHFTVTYVII